MHRVRGRIVHEMQTNMSYERERPLTRAAFAVPFALKQHPVGRLSRTFTEQPARRRQSGYARL